MTSLVQCAELGLGSYGWYDTCASVTGFVLLIFLLGFLSHNGALCGHRFTNDTFHEKGHPEKSQKSDVNFNK